VGLFPAVLGFFGGAAAGLGILPFNGLELQAGSLILLIIGAKLLSKPNVCKID
jgi:DMSO/TMAO reductase YedYZ heme-binding membrane subunit